MEETLIPPAEAGSLACESFVPLSTSLFGNGRSGKVRTLLVTSPTRDCGKTTIAVNLARSAAHADVHTLLLDADMRERALTADLGFADYPGLSTLLDQPAYLSCAERAEVAVARAVFLPAGPAPASAACLLASSHLKGLLRDMRERFELVVIDSPPVLAVTDATVLGTFVDGVLLVVDLEITRRRALKKTLEVLRRVNVNVLGMVVNRVADGHLEYSRYKGYGLS